MNHARVEIENNDRFFWYVCEECRGEVKAGDMVCSHCQAILSWAGVILELCRREASNHGKDL